MKEKLSSFERRIEVLFHIVHNRKTTISEICTIFSICENTAYSDIVFLSRYAPIYTKTGCQGGIFLMGDFNNSLFLSLTRDEESLLQKYADKANGIDKIRLVNIINKFAMPTIGK